MDLLRISSHALATGLPPPWWFPLDAIETGDYTLLLRVQDKIQQRDVRERVSFKVIPTEF